MPNFTVVIPARYNSSRLPGKPLRDIVGRTMIQHVYERAQESGAETIVVATDDVRIVKAVEDFGGRVVLTSKTHKSGTDRLAQVVDMLGLGDDEIVVNLQGDEPLMDPSLLQLAATALEENPAAGIATLATPLQTREDLFNPNIVKVVSNRDGMAITFSRAPIPWVRGDFCEGSKPGAAMPENVPFFRHLGLYAYRGSVLREYPSLSSCALEEAEALEQLRALWHGIDIHVSVIDEAPGHGVDTEEDLKRVQEFMRRDERRI